MHEKNIFKPYLYEIERTRYNGNVFRFCIPKKFCNSIKKDDTTYICGKCAKSVPSEIMDKWENNKKFSSSDFIEIKVPLAVNKKEDGLPLRPTIL